MSVEAAEMSLPTSFMRVSLSTLISCRYALLMLSLSPRNSCQVASLIWNDELPFVCSAASYKSVLKANDILDGYRTRQTFT